RLPLEEVAADEAVHESPGDGDRREDRDVDGEDAAADGRHRTEVQDQQFREPRERVAAEELAQLGEARVRPARIVGLEQNPCDDEDRRVNRKDGWRLRRVPEPGRPVRSEPHSPGEDPAGPERDAVQRDERERTERHLRARGRNHDRVSAAARVPQATIVQNTPMILNEANVSMSTALMDAAVTASTAPYTIARRSGSVSRRTARTSTHTSAASRRTKAVKPATPVSASTRTYQPSIDDGLSY